ncbi:MAG: hypothetical protein KC635_19505, partial [Myxococcales bacterium]|nr:hypothetical protein [Myxococcales bacterium]
PYNLDGRYLGDDPRTDRDAPPHPARHELVAAPPSFACTACHHDGARVGPSYEGYRERGGGAGPAHPGIMGVALYGNDANFYVTDEDTTNDWDETPPDVHFTAGLRCADCHDGADVHGDGHLAADLQCASKATCEGCHGTARARVALSPSRPRLFERDGRVFLRTVAAGVELEVPQVVDAVTPGSPRFTERAAVAMGVAASGASHTDSVACATCHSAFVPSCYGCHVTVDLTEADVYQATGATVPGRVTAERGAVALYDLVLMRDETGRYAPSMPAERLFVTLLEPDGAGGRVARFRERPRAFTTDDGRVIAGFGQRAVSPHTIQRTSQLGNCDRCHAVGSAADPENAALLDLTYGFGTDRFDVVACPPGDDAPCDDLAADGVTYRLDAVVDREGRPLVAVGHGTSRPLTLAEMARMRAVVVPAETPVPDDAREDPAWPGPLPPAAPGPSP